MIQTITAILLILLFSAFNGANFMRFNYFNYPVKAKYYNDQLHIIGWLFRFVLVFSFWENWIMMLVMANLSYTGFEFVINKWMKQDWFYVGNTAKLDKLITKYGLTAKKLIIIFKIALFLFTIYYLIKF
jgi:hypothetical protein